MAFLRQLGMLLYLNLLGLPQRLGLACTTVIGVTCAVGVLVAMLAMSVGARQAAMGDVRADRASVLSVDAVETDRSDIPRELAARIANLPGLRRNRRGRTIAVPEVEVYVEARRKASGSAVGFPMIGVGADYTDYAPELHLTDGRMFRPGLREIIASNECAHRYRNFNVGNKRLVGGDDWLVVGNFDLGRTAGRCFVYGDADTVLSTFKRNSYNAVDVMLQSPEAFDELVNAIKGNPQLPVRVEHEAELAAAGVQQIEGMLKFVSYFVGAILALAATIGAANSLYALVDRRRRQHATLLAIGFTSAPIIASTLSESILLAIPGSVIGAGLAWLFFDGLSSTVLDFSFHLAVTPGLVAVGIGWALGIGVISGLLPAVRAARIPITVALRTK
ncbi:MAG TPA: ABC transporter permease [Steroidobacteraceae bacterium]|nr:ABC transporter permease [Steroidobacteraceae bacterium]